MLTSWMPERGGDVPLAPPKASPHGDEDIATPITNGEATSSSPWLRPVRGDEDIAAPEPDMRGAESSLPSACGWVRLPTWKSHLRSD
jgi:hypothetical protein